MTNHLHIISFNVPYPADYGGVIDIYYKLFQLHRLGIRITLHCFQSDRAASSELAFLCDRVFYYRRKTGLSTVLSFIPYNVHGRSHPSLIQNLLRDNAPILFECLHSCHLLSDPRLAGRFKLVRMGNIEHDYYRSLAAACRRLPTKLFLFMEAWKLKRYERVLAHADVILGISKSDTDYFQKRFPDRRVVFIPPFHHSEAITSAAGQSDFILYHGKLSVYENERTALYLINNVFAHLKHACVIAGANPSKAITKAASKYPNIRIESDLSPAGLNALIKSAYIHLLITFQATGMKLKLLNALFNGRHVIANHLMTEGSGLERLCAMADTSSKMIATCNALMLQPFTAKDIRAREGVLIPSYSPVHLAERILSLLPKAGLSDTSVVSNFATTASGDKIHQSTFISTDNPIIEQAWHVFQDGIYEYKGKNDIPLRPSTSPNCTLYEHSI